eukprot:Cvel_16576.t1-p1 / transcript=Cvel_16576.t1 / gene=Cvel_16576 / organism=Chromera_velia_CCMP2878 / gene_product=hypothetical protein / transcript_product=hypothetical protein / location=Cvel_scaffold1283:62-7060(+) / protein_length=964 / sequence_SO=supercontig / SO=protein_coding / is_pseudo=false
MGGILAVRLMRGHLDGFKNAFDQEKGFDLSEYLKGTGFYLLPAVFGICAALAFLFLAPCLTDTFQIKWKKRLSRHVHLMTSLGGKMYKDGGWVGGGKLDDVLDAEMDGDAEGEEKQNQADVTGEIGVVAEEEALEAMEDEENEYRGLGKNGKVFCVCSLLQTLACVAAIVVVPFIWLGEANTIAAVYGGHCSFLSILDLWHNGTHLDEEIMKRMEMILAVTEGNAIDKWLTDQADNLKSIEAPSAYEVLRLQTKESALGDYSVQTGSNSTNSTRLRGLMGRGMQDDSEALTASNVRGWISVMNSSLTANPPPWRGTKAIKEDLQTLSSGLLWDSEHNTALMDTVKLAQSYTQVFAETIADLKGVNETATEVNNLYSDTLDHSCVFCYLATAPTETLQGAEEGHMLYMTGWGWPVPYYTAWKYTTARDAIATRYDNLGWKYKRYSYTTVDNSTTTQIDDSDLNMMSSPGTTYHTTGPTGESVQTRNDPSVGNAKAKQWRLGPLASILETLTTESGNTFTELWRTSAVVRQLFGSSQQTRLREDTHGTTAMMTTLDDDMLIHRGALDFLRFSEVKSVFSRTYCILSGLLALVAVVSLGMEPFVRRRCKFTLPQGVPIYIAVVAVCFGMIALILGSATIITAFIAADFAEFIVRDFLNEGGLMTYRVLLGFPYPGGGRQGFNTTAWALQSGACFGYLNTSSSNGTATTQNTTLPWMGQGHLLNATEVYNHYNFSGPLVSVSGGKTGWQVLVNSDKWSEIDKPFFEWEADRIQWLWDTYGSRSLFVLDPYRTYNTTRRALESENDEGSEQDEDEYRKDREASNLRARRRQRRKLGRFLASLEPQEEQREEEWFGHTEARQLQTEQQILQAMLGSTILRHNLTLEYPDTVGDPSPLTRTYNGLDTFATLLRKLTGCEKVFLYEEGLPMKAEDQDAANWWIGPDFSTSSSTLNSLGFTNVFCRQVCMSFF